jgi:hypothetical protein
MESMPSRTLHQSLKLVTINYILSLGIHYSPHYTSIRRETKKEETMSIKQRINQENMYTKRNFNEIYFLQSSNTFFE